MKHLGLQKVLTRLALICVLALVGHSVSAHSWDVRVAQNSPTTLTFYVQHWHSPTSSTSGLSLWVDGTQYFPDQASSIPGPIPFATTSPFVINSSCNNRVGYATITIPYTGAPINVGPLAGTNSTWSPAMTVNVSSYVYVPNLNAPLPPNTGPCSSTPCSGAIVYAVSGAGGSASNLYEVCLSTGGTTLIGSTGYSGITGLAQNPLDNKWYAWSTSFGLIEIDINTGAGTLIGTTGSRSYADMTVDENGVFYVYGPDVSPRYASVDLSNGALTALADPGHYHRSSIQAVGGTMYMLANGTGNLYSFPFAGGAATFLGNVGVQHHNMLTRDPSTGSLITGFRASGGSQGTYPRCDPSTVGTNAMPLYSIDIATTNSTLISNACLGQFSAIAFGSNVTTASAPIPTVSEWGLIFLFLGFLSVGSAWMFRRQRNEAIA